MFQNFDFQSCLVKRTRHAIEGTITRYSVTLKSLSKNGFDEKMCKGRLSKAGYNENFLDQTFEMFENESVVLISLKHSREQNFQGEL